MKIGSDFDGVISATAPAMEVWAKYEYGVIVPQPWQWDMGLTLEQLVGMFTPEFFDSLVPYYKNLNALKQLQADGHEIHVVTHRPAESENTTIDWLDRYEFIPTTLTLHKDKEVVASHLGLERFIEDNLPNANKLAAVVKHSYLVNYDYNVGEVVPGVLRVDSVNEVRARLRLEQLGFDSPEEASGFIQTYTREEMIETVGN